VIAHAAANPSWRRRAQRHSKRRREIRAREAQADLFFKECLEIADRGKDNENESQARIQRDRF